MYVSIEKSTQLLMPFVAHAVLLSCHSVVFTVGYRTDSRPYVGPRFCTNTKACWRTMLVKGVQSCCFLTHPLGLVLHTDAHHFITIYMLNRNYIWNCCIVGHSNLCTLHTVERTKSVVWLGCWEPVCKCWSSHSVVSHLLRLCWCLVPVGTFKEVSFLHAGCSQLLSHSAIFIDC